MELVSWFSQNLPTEAYWKNEWSFPETSRDNQCITKPFTWAFYFLLSGRKGNLTEWMNEMFPRTIYMSNLTRRLAKLRYTSIRDVGYLLDGVHLCDPRPWRCGYVTLTKSDPEETLSGHTTHRGIIQWRKKMHEGSRCSLNVGCWLELQNICRPTLCTTYGNRVKWK